MKVLRISYYPPPPAESPTTIVVREIDLKDSLDIEALRKDALQPGAFSVGEVFEMDEGSDIAAATLEAGRRMHDDAERNMALLYHYDTAQFRISVERGMIAATKPAPLSVDQIKLVLEQMVTHPDYRSQQVIVIAEDMRLVTLRSDGEITVESLAI